MKIKNYTIEKDVQNRYWLSDNFKSGLLIFYYNRIETKKYHKNNLKQGYSLVNQCKGLYKQIIGWDYNITNKRVYSKIINSYIKNLI